MAQPLVFACTCPGCGLTVLVPAEDVHKPLPRRCQCRATETVDTPFGRREWDGCRDPRLLRECLAALRLRITPRKSRLIAVAVGRVVFDWCRNYSFREALAAGEELADTGTTAAKLDAVREGLRRFRHRTVGLACLVGTPDLGFGLVERSEGVPIAGVYRDLIPNPFVPVGWRREWFTSTVVSLARSMYDSRDYSLMPILADALLDAGCDHQLVQGHCRSGKPHARGCWVLDAILGRT